MPSASDDLTRTRLLFEQWRATRPGRSKIPDDWGTAAGALHGRYSASQLCQELRLSAGALRSRLPKAVPVTSSSLPTFVPLRAESLPWPTPTISTSAEKIRLVWERADGTRLHLCLPPSQWSQAEALCTAFWRS